MKMDPVYFVNACYESYCECFIYVCILYLFIFYLDTVMFNPNVLTQSSGENDRLLSGKCMPDFSNHIDG